MTFQINDRFAIPRTRLVCVLLSLTRVPVQVGVNEKASLAKNTKTATRKHAKHASEHT